jgi:hypothetical protein
MCESRKRLLRIQALEQFYSLTAFFFRAHAAIPDLHGTQETSAIWAHVHENLLHNHAWVRLSSARLMGVYFGSLDVAKLCAAMGGMRFKRNNSRNVSVMAAV